MGENETRHSSESGETDSQIKQKFLNRLRHYRNDFTEQRLPRLHRPATDELYYQRKYRKGYFSGIGFAIGNIVDFHPNMLSEEARKSYRDFMDYCLKADWHDEKLIEKRDVDKANQLLDMLIQELSANEK